MGHKSGTSPRAKAKISLGTPNKDIIYILGHNFGTVPIALALISGLAESCNRKLQGNYSPDSGSDSPTPGSENTYAEEMAFVISHV